MSLQSRIDSLKDRHARWTPRSPTRITARARIRER